MYLVWIVLWESENVVAFYIFFDIEEVQAY